MSNNDRPQAEPVVLRAPSSDGTRYEEVRLPLTEKDLARERLRAKVDVLAETASLKVQLQKEPLKMLGGASAVGAVLGLALGSQLKRTKKIYVDANSPVKYQKRLLKAQQKEQGTDLGGALVATLVTVGARALSNTMVRDRLQNMAEDLLVKAGQNPQGGQPASRSGGNSAGGQTRQVASALPRQNQSAAAAPARQTSNPAVSRFLKPGSNPAEASSAPATTSTTVTAAPSAQTQTQPAAAAPAPANSGMEAQFAHAPAPAAGTPEDPNGPVRHAEVPGSTVSALADGAPIQRTELKNPNAG